MFCPSCGADIPAELKYCNRCGAHLSTPAPTYAPPVIKPVRMGLPSVVLGLMVTIGLAIIFNGAFELARIQLHPAAVAWIVIFSLATLFGCTALLLRVWLKIVSMNRDTFQPQQLYSPPVQAPQQIPAPRQQFPRLEPMGSVTEHTTRTFNPVYREGSDPSSR